MVTRCWCIGSRTQSRRAIGSDCGRVSVLGRGRMWQWITIINVAIMNGITKKNFKLLAYTGTTADVLFAVTADV